jgi:YHS domain-containing protein
MMQTPICPGCGCSLVRLGLKDEDAVRYRHADVDYQFCCHGCVEVFTTDPEKYLEEIRDVIVCPSCLAEKPLAAAVSFEHEGNVVHLCRCPHCLQEFKREPDRLLQRLRG